MQNENEALRRAVEAPASKNAELQALQQQVGLIYRKLASTVVISPYSSVVFCTFRASEGFAAVDCQADLG